MIRTCDCVVRPTDLATSPPTSPSSFRSSPCTIVAQASIQCHCRHCTSLSPVRIGRSHEPTSFSAYAIRNPPHRNTHRFPYARHLHSLHHRDLHVHVARLLHVDYFYTIEIYMLLDCYTWITCRHKTVCKCITWRDHYLRRGPE